MTNHKWDKKCNAVDKKLRDKNKSYQENDKNEEVPSLTGQSMTQNNNKLEQPKQYFKCGKDGHIAPDCPHKDEPKAEWWINKQNRISAHQKAICIELAETVMKK